MASPIFVSNPNSSFSLVAVLKGAQFALQGTYRLLQNHQFFESSKYFRFTFFTMYVSVIIQLLLSIPYAVIKLLRLPEGYHDLVSSLEEEILNIQTLILLVFHCIYHDIFDDIVISGLEYISAVFGKNYAVAIRKSKALSHDGNEMNPNSFTFNSFLCGQFPKLTNRQSSHLKWILWRYAEITMSNILLLLCSYSDRYGHLLVSIQVSRYFNNKLGSSLSFAIFFFGLFIPTSIYIQIISATKISLLSMASFLTMPYFQRLGLSDPQIRIWMDSRMGVSLGFGLAFLIIQRQLNYICLLIVLLQQLGLAFFIFKTTDPVPDNISDAWVLTQTYWARGYRISDLIDIDSDGFRSFKGSYMFGSTPSSAPSSGVITPARSATNLQDLTINTVH